MEGEGGGGVLPPTQGGQEGVGGGGASVQRHLQAGAPGGEVFRLFRLYFIIVYFDLVLS